MKSENHLLIAFGVGLGWILGMFTAAGMNRLDLAGGWGDVVGGFAGAFGAVVAVGLQFHFHDQRQAAAARKRKAEDAEFAFRLIEPLYKKLDALYQYNRGILKDGPDHFKFGWAAFNLQDEIERARTLTFPTTVGANIYSTWSRILIGLPHLASMSNRAKDENAHKGIFHAQAVIRLHDQLIATTSGFVVSVLLSLHGIAITGGVKLPEVKRPGTT